jgi:hypothetical protein
MSPLAAIIQCGEWLGATMKHGRADYARIQDPGGKIPHDEPVFLLRAQDALAATAVRFYASLVQIRGGDPEIVRQAREQAARMDAWPRKKMPDLPKMG